MSASSNPGKQVSFFLCKICSDPCPEGTERLTAEKGVCRTCDMGVCHLKPELLEKHGYRRIFNISRHEMSIFIKLIQEKMSK